MAKQMTKKQQVSNQVALPKVEKQVVKLKVNNQATAPEADQQEAQLEGTNQAVASEVDNQAVVLEESNPAVSPEVENPVAAAEGDHSVTILNFVWDEWLNTIKLGQAYQREMEGIAFKAIEQQKDIWVKSLENLGKVEVEINKFADHAKSYFLESLKHLNAGSFSKNVEEWNKQVEELANQVQKTYGTPNQTISSLVGKSFDQIESAWRTTLQQQEKGREEVQVLTEKFIDQVKATNKVLLNTWEARYGSLAN